MSTGFTCRQPPRATIKHSPTSSEEIWKFDDLPTRLLGVDGQPVKALEAFNDAKPKRRKGKGKQPGGWNAR